MPLCLPRSSCQIRFWTRLPLTLDEFACEVYNGVTDNETIACCLPYSAVCLTLLLSAACALASAQTPVPPLRDLGAEMWAGTDALGRSLPMAGQARPLQKGKFVGLFYFLWHSRADTPYDNTKLLAADPAQAGRAADRGFWGEF